VARSARRIYEQRLLDIERIGQIPIDDAEAALRFCQALASQLGKGASAALEYQDQESGDSHLAASLQNAAEPELSVVVPVYNEEENIPVLYDRLVRVLEGASIDFEIVFVDDGSCDQSIAKINIAASDQRVRVVELARNFGHQIAITAGLDFARGKAVAVMDADLQDPPEVLPAFVAKWREGHDVVYAVRARRQETWLLRASYAVFYRLLRRVANVEIPLDAGDFCVMDRRVVDLLKSMP
jgi:dolichol-phosphate mannosyltransferase